MPLGGLTTRRLVLALLLLGVTGSGAELLLLGHTEERLQLVPLVVLGLGLVTGLVAAFHQKRGPILALAGVMGLFVLSGIVGLVVHFRGNMEFELEMYPSMKGLDLVRESMTGATPALAPGTLCMLGLLGLIYCYRHPRLRLASDNADPPREHQE